MTEFEKMISGNLCNGMDKTLLDLRIKAKIFVHKLNNLEQMI